MARTPEGKVKDKVKAMLERHGVYYSMKMTFGAGISGDPDFTCCVNGWFLGIECKANAKKEPTDLQLKRKREIEAAGGKWCLVRDQPSLEMAEDMVRILKDFVR
jgi:hypothetical protein